MPTATAVATTITTTPFKYPISRSPHLAPSPCHSYPADSSLRGSTKAIYWILAINTRHPLTHLHSLSPPFSLSRSLCSYINYNIFWHVYEWECVCVCGVMAWPNVRSIAFNFNLKCQIVCADSRCAYAMWAAISIPIAIVIVVIAIVILIVIVLQSFCRCCFELLLLLLLLL